MANKLGDVSVGSIVKIKENGSPVEFYVAKHDYESGLNGSGRTLVVRKDCYDIRAWHSSYVNAWASCTLRSWLNGNYLNLLDEDIRGAIGTTKYYYTPGNGTTSVTTRSDAVFQLSVTELGKSATYANAEGTALPIASTLQIAYRNGSAAMQWTRSPYTGDTYSACYLYASGGVSSGGCASTNGSRPAFTLPSSLSVGDDGTVSVNTAPTVGLFASIDSVKRELDSMVATVDGVQRNLDSVVATIDGVQRELFRKGIAVNYVNYIESTGAQYINTGYKLKSQKERMVIKFRYTASYSGKTLIGTQDSSYTTATLYSINFYQNQLYVANSHNVYQWDASVGTDYEFDITANGSSLTVVNNGTTTTAALSGSLDNKDNIIVFAGDIAGAVNMDQAPSARLYYLQIYDNDELVIDYWPCLDADGVACLYDKVNEQYIYNAGTGSFLYG